TQPYILRFYAGNTGLVTNTLLTGGTSGKSFTPLAITISSGTLAGANAAGLMLVDSLQNLTATETLVNSASTVVANTVASIVAMPITRGQTARAVVIIPEAATIRVNADGYKAGSNANNPANFGQP